MTTRSAIAKAKMPAFSRGVCALTVAMEIAQKIEGPGDENGSAGRQCPRAGGPGVGLDLDPLEEPASELGQLRGGNRAWIRGLRRHEGPADDREGLEHELGALVPQDGCDDDELVVREPRQEVADAGEIVRAVPYLERPLAPALEAAGQPDPFGRGCVDGGAEERLGGGHGEREVASCGHVDAGGAVRECERRPLRLAQNDDR